MEINENRKSKRISEFHQEETIADWFFIQNRYMNFYALYGTIKTCKIRKILIELDINCVKELKWVFNAFHSKFVDSVDEFVKVGT